MRIKLLLMLAVALVFPLAGWRFLVEMETTLRQGQEAALLASAHAAAQAFVALEPDLAPRLVKPEPLYVRRVSVPLELDGYADDWAGVEQDAQLLVSSKERQPPARVSLVRGARGLYLWIEVVDGSPVRADLVPGRAQDVDQVLIHLEDADGIRSYRLHSAAEGPLRAEPMVNAQGRIPTLGVAAVWHNRPDGYTIEALLPEPRAPASLGLEIIDYAGARADQIRDRYGTGSGGTPGATRPLVEAGRDDAVLAALLPEATRGRVVGPGGHVLRRGGQLIDRKEEDLSFLRWLRAMVYRWLMAPPLADPDGYGPEQRILRVQESALALDGVDAVGWRPAGSLATVILSAAAPLPGGRGAVVLERSADALLIWTNRGLGGLLLGGFLSVLAAAAVLFGYASYLSLRIRLLRNAAENALTPEGRLREGFPRSRASDEVGDLSRSFARLLDQVHAYTGYLRSLAGKLSHELATPLAVVRSSLENLEHEQLPESARVYAERARGGAERLRAILRAMSEAGRIERAVDSAEPEEFDLGALVANAGAGYRDLTGERQLRLQIPTRSIPLRGAPELIHQALDKLVDNALSFSPEDGVIEIGCATTVDGASVWVSNQGPPLPEEMQDRLFESLVSLRQGGAESPHLGLGLYIVRLVAELHRGQARASNRPQGDGVVFTLELRSIR
ncbi:MAG: histidine kinase [Xanthomonadales bacterium]|nr:histidine kinase [Xanthomonadales bacterium]